MIINQQREYEIAATAFEELLAQYGFSSGEAYKQAHLPKAEREGLAKEVEDYRRRFAANGQLRAHLEQVITAKAPLDVENLKEEIQNAGQNKNRPTEANKDGIPPKSNSAFHHLHGIIYRNNQQQR
jgi:hypothetical protein